MHQTPTHEEISNRLHLVPTSQAALIVHLSPRTLEGLRSRGGGPIYCQLGRKILYDINDLIEWAEKNKRRSTCDQR